MLEDLISERRKKLELLREKGVDPYPARTKRSFPIAEALKKFPTLSRSKKKVYLAGRIRGLRDQGGVVFADLEDESGRIQLVLKKENLISHFSLLKTTLDIGDFASGGGALFTTKKGEKSLEVREVQILAKSLRPLPDQWAGLEETETRLRQRYLDLLMEPEVRQLFQKKALFWGAVREFMKRAGFLEVETPVFELVPGGADAEPFVTHHNALDQDFYLRISLELPLKKLLVGGFEAVFEIGRIFRNEGIDREHLQDYTQLEFYWAYHDYNDLAAFVEKLYKATVKSTIGGLTTTWEGKKINWGAKWPRLDYGEIFKKMNQLDPTVASQEELVKKARSLDIKIESYYGKGRLIDLIFKHTVRPTLVQPVLLINYPVDVSPLSKRSSKNPNVVERLQVMACGTEIGNGWSELNDPIDQRKRFEEQMKLREAGDKEAQRLDEEFLTALEYGMPPAAGFGMSERFFSILMDKPIRETVIFPLMRPKR